MAKRRLKLLALALSILVARSFAALIQISRVTQVNRHKAPRTTRCALSASNFAQVAQYWEPFATVFGISLKDIVVGVQAASNNIDSLSGQKTLVDSKYAREHAESLAKTLVESIAKSEQFRNIFLPRILLPRIPVNGTKFQHLVSNVLSDTSFTGASSIHAEPGVGKSVAVVLAMLEWAKYNPKSITVLFRGLHDSRTFFRVEDITLVPVVAELLFPMLGEAGVRLQLILDNIFDKDLVEGKIVMDLAKAAFDYGQVIVVTQSEVVAKDVDDLNGLRTRLAPERRSTAPNPRRSRMQCRWPCKSSKRILSGSLRLWKVHGFLMADGRQWASSSSGPQLFATFACAAHAGLLLFSSDFASLSLLRVS